MEHKTCRECLHYDACKYGVLSTKQTDCVNAEYCKAFKDSSHCSITPCAVGDTLYRVWTCGGNRTIAAFKVIALHKMGGLWIIDYQSAHSAKWNNPVVRHADEADPGITVFLSRDEAEKRI